MYHSFQSINEVAEHAIDAVRKTQARRFLRRFRLMLKDTNLNRHQLVIGAGMGIAGVWVMNVNDDSTAYPFSDMRCAKPSRYEARAHAYLLEPMVLIRLIDETLDPAWAYHLDAEPLNMARYRTPAGIIVRTFGQNSAIETYADGLAYRVNAELDSSADFHKARAVKVGQAVSIMHDTLRRTMLADRAGGDQPAMEGLEVDDLVKAIRRTLRQQLDLV